MAKSRNLGLFSTVVVAVVASAVTIGASNYLPLPGGSGTDAGDEKIKEIVATFIKENPQAIVESLQNMQLRAESDRAKKQADAVKALKGTFHEKALFPVAGNPDGDIDVVVFYDYNCPACKALFESIDALVHEDEKVRVLFGEFPIFGPQSDTNAKIALAVYNLGGSENFFKFHTSMMRHKGKADENFALNTVRGIGLDPEAVKAEISKPDYQQHLAKIHDIAQQLDVRGTPAIIINDRMFNGVIDYNSIKTHIQWSRDDMKSAGENADENADEPAAEDAAADEAAAEEAVEETAEPEASEEQGE